VYAGAPNGIPYTIVSARTRRVPVHFQYASESDGHSYPIPRGAPIEGGPRATGDRHMILVDRSTCTDYELYAAYPHAQGRSWTAGSGAIFDLRSDRLRPAGWTSADAAGLPILPGLARSSEVTAGRSIKRCASPRRAPAVASGARRTRTGMTTPSISSTVSAAGTSRSSTRARCDTPGADPARRSPPAARRTRRRR